MLHHEIKNEPLAFLVLGIILVAGLIAFFLSSGDPHQQRRVIYVMAAAYFFWSLYYHYRLGDLHFSIVIEYLLMALFATILITSTLI